MSDQVPSAANVATVDGRNLINVPGGSGTLLSINGDNTPAQVLVGLGSCVVIDVGGGIHQINVPVPITAFLTSINADVTPAQVLAAGAGITIVDGGGGLHTISATMPAAITSLNGDTTAAQVIAAGGGIAIVDVGNTHTIVNSDPAVPLQVAQTVSLGDSIANNANTGICSATVPVTGFCQVTANVKYTTVPAGVTEYSLILFDDFNAVVVASQSMMVPAGATLAAQLNCTAAVQAVAGHTFTMYVYQNSGGALVTTASPDLLTSLTIQFLGV